MNGDDRVIELLERIEANQREALEVQQRQLQIAQEQQERSNKTIQQSIELQRVAVARQAKISRYLVPLIGILLALLIYLLFKWRII